MIRTYSLNTFLTCLGFFISLTASRAQSFTDSNLPIFSINTFSQYIYDEPKIQAELTVYYHPNGSRNYLTDTAYMVIDIGIEQRGSSSATVAKPSYGFETWDSLGNELDTSWFNMPSESDWILYASHIDKTFIRNPLTCDIYRRMGHYASRVQYCEVVINGFYQGVYILMEKIKRDDGRVDIAKLKNSDTSGVDLTGGYIIKSDKITGSGGGGFQTQWPNTAGNNIFLQFEYPSDVDIQPQQANYIAQYVDSFQTALFGNNFTDPALGYRNYANSQSFIDFMLLAEAAKNPDTYVLSTYIFKPKDTDGRKLEMGPVWDFDLAWKNSYYLGADTLTGFIYNQPIGRIAWWVRMMQDTSFVNELNCRWNELRQDQLSIPRIHFWIDSMATLLNEGQQRNFTLWPVLGQNVYYNSFPYPLTYQDEIDTLKSWVTRRITWLDGQFGAACLTGVDETSLAAGSILYPNPFSDNFTLRISSSGADMATVSLYDISGQRIAQRTGLTLVSGKNELEFSELNNYSPGIYLITIQTKAGNQTLRIVKL